MIKFEVIPGHGLSSRVIHSVEDMTYKKAMKRLTEYKGEKVRYTNKNKKELIKTI